MNLKESVEFNKLSSDKLFFVAHENEYNAWEKGERIETPKRFHIRKEGLRILQSDGVHKNGDIEVIAAIPIIFNGLCTMMYIVPNDADLSQGFSWNGCPTLTTSYNDKLRRMKRDGIIK